MSATILSKEDLDYLMRGACFLGSGGGGSIELATKIKEKIEEILKDPSISLTMVDLEDVAQDDMLCMVAGVGAPTKKASFKDSPLFAVTALEKEAKTPFRYVIPVETGAVNSLIPLLVTAKSRNRVPLVNADGGGRAFPQLQLCTYALSGVSCHPAVIANEEGDVVVSPEKFPKDLDLWVRKIITSDPKFSGAAMLATFSMTGDQVKQKDRCVPSALLNAIKVGEVLKRFSRDGWMKQITNILGRTVTPLMVEGRFSPPERIPDPYFDVGTVTLSGKGPLGPEIQICFVNENIAVRVDKKPLRMAPDMLCYLSTEGEPFTNAELMKHWDTWKNKTVMLTLIEPAAEINRPEEIGHFKQLYDKYFKNR